MNEKHVVIIGGGFAGLTAAKRLSRNRRLKITLVDRRNHHLFQPLLYQVAMAGLSPADIASPIRGILSRYKNIRVICGEVERVDADAKKILTLEGSLSFDYLMIACGAVHSYFGRNDWEANAPGLKTIEQATEIRRRVLSAFERAEVTEDPAQRKRELTFIVVGGGPTGVELAGAIGEMSRYTLSRDFRNIDASQSRIILVEAGPRILPMFHEKLSSRAMRDLESLGVQVWTNSAVTNVTDLGVDVADEHIDASTVLWAAGVKASSLGMNSGFECDRAGRIVVGTDLSIPQHSNIFVAGDQCGFIDSSTNRQLPGIAPVAVQQGKFIAKLIQNDMQKKERTTFKYVDKGQMATIGRSRAITEIGKYRFAGFFAWFLWLVIHIYFLTGFRNRFFVVINWAWSFLTFRRGARLIVGKKWRTYESKGQSLVGK